MGIKFLCPNGHKLHVKSFLAGKRAICPQCGEKVIVPAEDAFNSSDVGTVSVEIPTLSTSSNTELSSESSIVAARNQNAGGSIVSQSAAATATTDPIGEAPSAVWYVRPATGGQFGPASGDIMRNWVRDGRVGASSLVWRAGWEEWRSAAEIFPELKDLLTAPIGSSGSGSGPMPSLPQGLAVQHIGPSAAPQKTESSAAPVPQAGRKRRRRNEVSLMATGILLAVALILLVVLMLVFRSQMSPAEAGPKPGEIVPPAAAE